MRRLFLCSILVATFAQLFVQERDTDLVFKGSTLEPQFQISSLPSGESSVSIFP